MKTIKLNTRKRVVHFLLSSGVVFCHGREVAFRSEWPFNHTWTYKWDRVTCPKCLALNQEK